MNQVKKKSNKRLILFWDIIIILGIAATLFLMYTDGGIGLIFTVIPAYCFWCREDTIECAIKEEACEEMIKKLEKYAQTYQEENK